MTFDAKKNPLLFFIEFLLLLALKIVVLVVFVIIVVRFGFNYTFPIPFLDNLYHEPYDNREQPVQQATAFPDEAIRRCYVVLVYDITSEHTSLRLEYELKKSRINLLRYHGEDGRYYLYVGPRNTLAGARQLLEAVEKHVGRRRTMIVNVATMKAIDGYLSAALMTPLLKDMCK